MKMFYLTSVFYCVASCLFGRGQRRDERLGEENEMGLKEEIGLVGLAEEMGGMDTMRVISDKTSQHNYLIGLRSMSESDES